MNMFSWPLPRYIGHTTYFSNIYKDIEDIYIADSYTTASYTGLGPNALKRGR